jgi:tRNA G26 N,N-dimethylase Trm1
VADLPSGATPPGSPSPYRGRIRLLLGLIGACAAVLLAIAGGVFSWASDHHRYFATCTVDSISGREMGRSSAYWSVESSCGQLTINTASTVTSTQAAGILGVIADRHDYRFTIAGFRQFGEKDIVGVDPA